MIRIIRTIFAYILLFNANIAFASVIKREQPIEMTTTVIIPCVAKHFKHLENLLSCYQTQTCLPDQIVISLSQSEILDEQAISALEQHPWPYSLKILKHVGKKSAGQNRNLACKEADGLLILCQDADDLPHPQRVEIVKFLFEHYYVDHLIHALIHEGKTFVSYVKEQVQMKKFNSYWDAIEYSGMHLTNGQVCFRKEVSNAVEWNDTFQIGEDLAFNQEVYARFEHNIVAYAALCLYRNSLSSFLPNN